MRAFLLSGLALGLCLSACTADRGGKFDPAAGGASPGGTTSSLAMGSGASSSSTTTSGTGGSGAEDCLNGVDDDGDSLVDCADDDCDPGFSCQPKGEIFVPTDNVACPGGTTEQEYFGCGDCSCEASGGSCTMTLTKHNAPFCGDTGTVVAPGECVSDASRIYSDNELVTSPTCQPSSPSQPQDQRVCVVAQTGGGCAANMACLPKPLADYAACDVVSEQCPQGADDRGLVYAGVGQCQCNCEVADVGCGPAAGERYFGSSTCSFGGADLEADGCHYAFTAGSMAVFGVPEATASCIATATSINNAAPVGRLCCVQP